MMCKDTTDTRLRRHFLKTWGVCLAISHTQHWWMHSKWCTHPQVCYPLLSICAWIITTSTRMWRL